MDNYHLSAGVGNQMRIVWATLAVGIPLSLLGLAIGWNMHPGGGLLFIVALIPTALLVTREIVPREQLWLWFPLVQFIYYFVLVAMYYGARALIRKQSGSERKQSGSV